MDKIEFETLKNDGFGAIFKKLRKFRQVPTNIFGFWFWKDVDVKLAFDQVQKYEMDIHSEEQILEYCDKLINYKIPVDKPQWMLKHIEDYQPGKSACIFLYQHCFTDGVGLVNSLLFFNNDDQHRPKKAPGSGRGIPWYYFLFYSILMPYCFITSVHEIFPKKWPDLFKVKSKTGNSGMSKNLITKEYEFEQLRK